nr:DNA-processing protein DprA [Streptomyces sp. SID5468]
MTRITEPGDRVVGRSLRERGAEATLRALVAGRGLPGMGARRAAGYRARAERADPDADLATVTARGGRFICPGDPEWPGQLADLGDEEPVGLWLRGRPNLRLWALRSVAVVGARACTEYGNHVGAALGAGLAEAGWTVVSGAAHGVDGAAHRGALAAGGATVGVVAGGVDVHYPPSHAELLERIAQQGLLVGELAPGDHPTRSRFVLRNRVIAALTRGTVVVEARLRSGSLITARRAAELGRVVMAVPGPVTSDLSSGTHGLLRGTAQLVTDAADVVELVGSIGDDLSPPRRGPVLPRDLLPRGAAQVLDALPARGAAPAEAVARQAATTPDDALARLHELRALGFVTHDDTGWRLARPAGGGRLEPAGEGGARP